MVISQAAVINLKSFNPSSIGGDKTLTGKVTSFSKGVLTVQVGADSYNLKIDQGNFKAGENITFLLTDGGSNAHIFSESNQIPSDNILLQIAPQLKDLLTTFDLAISSIDDQNGNIKKKLLSLLALIKDENISQKSLANIISQIKSIFEKNQTNFSTDQRSIINELIFKLETVQREKKYIDSSTETLSASKSIKEHTLSVKGESIEKIHFFKTRNDLLNFINKVTSGEESIRLPLEISRESVVHAEPKGSGELKLHIFSGDALQNVLKHISYKSFESEFMKKEMSSQLLSIVKDAGVLNLNSAKVLDSIILKNFPQLESNLSMNNISTTISQILTFIDSLENDKLSILEKIIPHMINSIKEEMDELIQAGNRKLSEAINKVFDSISNSFIKNGGKDFFQSLFKLIGLEKESDLSNQLLANNSLIKGPGESLKDILLTFLEDTDKNQELNQNRDEKKNIALQQKNINTVVSNSSNQSERGTSSSILRERVEQVINKIEAIQVLAKKVPTVNGESQLITIPVNINNEWSEIRLRFKKEKNSKTENKSEKTSVLLNIELSIIGEVAAEMNFLKNRDLSINILLSNKPTLDWFSNNKTEIIESLMKYNFNSVKLDFKELMKEVDIIDKSVIDKDRFDVSA